MSVRITRTGNEVVLDHNELANKGKRTHAEIDSYLQELDDAREDKPSLKDRFRELKDKDDEQDRQLDAVKSDVSTIQARLNTLSSTVSAAEAKNQTQDLRLSQVEQKNAQQDQAILKLQSDVSSNPNAEVVAARRDRDGRTFPSLKARLDDMQGKIGTGDDGGGTTTTKPLVDVVAATNILRNAYRTLESTGQGATVRHNLYADSFVNTSGVDISKSESFQIGSGKFTKSAGSVYSWKTLGVQIASSVGDYSNSNTGYRPYKANGTTSVYSVEKIADDNAVASPGGYSDYWLQSGTSADLFMKWEALVDVSKVILWMNGSFGSNGHHYCDHQIFVKNPFSGKWDAVTPRINLASSTDKGIHGDGSWHYPISLDYLINEVKVTVWNKSTYMTVTEIQILQASDKNPVMVSKPIPLAKAPTHLVLDAEYEGNISIDLSLDGGTTFTAGFPLNQLVDLSTFLPGNSLVIRANLTDKALLNSIGCIWYDEDTLPTYTDTVGGSSGGKDPGNSGTKVEVDPSLGSILLYDTIGLITANFRAAEALNLPKYTAKNLIIDSFIDDSGIDKTRSSGFIVEQGEVKRMGHNAVKGKTYYLNPIPTKNYPDNTPYSKLTDGKAGKDGSAADYLDGSWISQLGIPGSISTVDFDLTVPEIINRVKAMFCEYQVSGIFYPPELYVYGSDDNSNWTLLFHEPSGLSGNGIRKWVDFTFTNSTPYRYYRVGYSIGGTGENQKHLFVNEIELYSTGPTTIYTNVESLPVEPKKMIVIAEHQGQVIYDLSMNGGNTWLNNITLDKFLEVTGGKEVCIRATLSTGSTLSSLGYGWFDDSVEFIKVTPGSGNTGSTGLIQINKFGVIASPNTPEEVNITIPYTSDYKLPPIEVLKFAPGEQNYSLEIASFSSNEASNFDHDNYLELEGMLRLKTDYLIEMTEDVVLSSGNSVYSFNLDVNQYSSIEKIEVT
ncbi:hypothetical protein AB432_003750 [Brevibacillus brevis]|uniref:Uncharacterized protein n=1 Tax=Brevibacillus brevis TaxID=1393 RepID=A0A2Z4MCI9_BREBE|nr:hypothetical protein [Brevibacillus brevis]AWX54206.1 hypothetical protein AB432_003750 [Brevibacillus brevis]